MTTDHRTDGEAANRADPLLAAMLNLSRVHREHEKFYSSEPRSQAVSLHRHARTLLALADRWATAEPSPGPALSPFAGADDLNADVATQLGGVLFMEGEGRPAEIGQLINELRAVAATSIQAGEWLSSAMQSAWEAAHRLIDFDGLAAALGDRHRIIANDWQAADLSRLAGRILMRAADLLDLVDFTPAGLRADLAHSRVASKRLYSAAELVTHAAELLSQAAGVEVDSEPRWRAFRHLVEQVTAGS